MYSRGLLRVSLSSHLRLTSRKRIQATGQGAGVAVGKGSMREGCQAWQRRAVPGDAPLQSQGQSPGGKVKHAGPTSWAGTCGREGTLVAGADWGRGQAPSSSDARRNRTGSQNQDGLGELEFACFPPQEASKAELAAQHSRPPKQHQERPRFPLPLQEKGFSTLSSRQGGL